MPRARRPRDRDGRSRKPAATRQPPPRRDPAARGQAKLLLRQGGEAFEQGDAALGRSFLERAVAADPSFVEPVLALAAWLGGAGDRDAALRLLDQAVERGEAQVARIPERPAGTAWWWDEATRPLMKAWVARAFAWLAGGQAQRAAEDFERIYLLEPDDPIGAGVYAAEAWLAAGEPMAALRLFAELEEQPAVCYGRGLALLRTGQRREAALSLWLAILLNTHVAEGLVPALPPPGPDSAEPVGDPAEARDLLARTSDLWSAPERAFLGALRADPALVADLRQWAELTRVFDRAEEPAEAESAEAAIADFLSPDRLEREVEALLARVDAAPARRRLL